MCVCVVVRLAGCLSVRVQNAYILYEKEDVLRYLIVVCCTCLNVLFARMLEIFAFIFEFDENKRDEENTTAAATT